MPVPIRTALAALAALALLCLLLGFPLDVDGLAWDRVALWPLELPAVVLVLALLPGRSATAFRVALVAALALLTLLRFADLGSHAAFGRAFSPLAELHLIGQGWELASRSVGPGQALALVAAVLVALGVVCASLYRGLGAVQRVARGRPAVAAVAAVSLAAGALALGREPGPGAPLVRADTLAELVHRLGASRRAVADQAAFSAELAADPLAVGDPPRFAALDGRDLVVLFVESYGRSWIDAPRFAAEAEDALADLDAVLMRSGLAVRSAWVDSPIRGGRSWLAQATLASGLSLTNHARFDRLLGSERRSLHRLFGDAGWRTAAVLPIVSGEWVEGAWYGVDRFLDGDALGYAGRDFGYVTMPDQYTLAAFQSRVREAADTPLMATVGLLGSHAPWTPLALPVDWDALGDGAIFDGSRRFGGPLDWGNPEPVRAMYGRSVELTLARIGEYLERHGRGALFLIVGDHQPAHVIAGWAPNSHVPLHVVADDPALLDRLPPMLFERGTVPRAEAPALPMAALRGLLGTAFEDGPRERPARTSEADR